MTSSSYTPPATAGLWGNWLEGLTAATTGVADLIAAELAAAPRAMDLVRWTTLMRQRERPTWSTPHEVVFEAPLARLRDFSTASPPRGQVPTLVLPPQAGHDSCIVDYSKTQSQMQTIVNAGLERAFTLDWIGATKETANCSVEDYLETIDRAVDHCGGSVNLIGDCQGGWLATIYAALNPERINTLTIAGAPIDFHAGEPVIGDVLGLFAPAGHLHFYEALVAQGGGVLKGRHMLSGFIMIQPGAEVSRQLELLSHLDDRQHISRYREFEDWFKWTQDIPGSFYLWIIRHLFCENGLIDGSVEIAGEHVDLGRLTMPLNLLAGQTDHITPPDQVFALAEYASTPPDKVMRRVTSGGHLGLFMGHEALREHWPPLLAQVAAESKPAARKPTARHTAARTPAARKPAARTPATRKPARRTPAAAA
jgi:poly(3-hydroxyalkanoate) synthetase